MRDPELSSCDVQAILCLRSSCCVAVVWVSSDLLKFLPGNLPLPLDALHFFVQDLSGTFHRQPRAVTAWPFIGHVGGSVVRRACWLAWRLPVSSGRPAGGQQHPWPLRHLQHVMTRLLHSPWEDVSLTTPFPSTGTTWCLPLRPRNVLLHDEVWTQSLSGYKCDAIKIWRV